MFRSVSRLWLALDIIGSVVGFLVTVPLSYVLIFGPLSSWLPDGVWTLLLQLVLCAVTWGAAAIGRLSPPLALIIAWSAAVVQMAAGFPPSAYNVADFVVLFAAAAWGTRRVLWIGGASVLVGGIIAGGYIAVQTAPDASAGTGLHLLTVASLSAAVVILALVIAWGAGLLWRVVIRERAANEAQRVAEATAAEEQERVRIARDMHDIVAHSLAVVIAQADGARYAASADPDAATAALTTIGQTARGALSDVRMLLTQLRHRQGDGPQPTLADLETLFAQVRQAGVEPRVTVDPTPPGEPPGAIQLAVYRILQEALTNAIRHGATTPVDVRLAWLADGVELEIGNDVAAASGTGGGTGTGGHGIIGMRERAQLVGGVLQAEREGDRFVVRARLPIAPAEAREESA